MSARVVLFWLLALIICTVVVAVVVWPLLKRQRRRSVVRKEINVQVLRDQLTELESDLQSGTLSQTQYDEAKLDVSKRLLEDLTVDPIAAAPTLSPARLAANRKLALGLGIGIPVLAAGLYLWLGTPVALQGDDGPAGTPVAANGGSGGSDGQASPGEKHAITADKIQAMIDGLKKKIEQSPNDAQAVAMLARSYNFVGKFPEAVEVYKKAIVLNPTDADLLADYADALAMTQGKTLGPEPMKLVSASLKLDPNNMKGLALSATEAFERKDYKAAIDYWKRAIPVAQTREPDLAQQFRLNIAEANQLGGGKLISDADIPGGPVDPAALLAAGGGAPAPAAAATPASDQASGGASLSGKVSLSAALKSKAGPEDSVFIFAKAASGPPMPVAVMRAKVKDLPMDFRLDESMAMMPGMKLGNFPELVVGARISKTGNAIPSSGDLQGLVKGVKPNTSGIKIDIADVVP